MFCEVRLAEKNVRGTTESDQPLLRPAAKTAPVRQPDPNLALACPPAWPPHLAALAATCELFSSPEM